MVKLGQNGWNWDNMVKLGHNGESGTEWWNWGKMVKMCQNGPNVRKKRRLWLGVIIMIFGQNGKIGKGWWNCKIRVKMGKMVLTNIVEIFMLIFHS